MKNVCVLIPFGKNCRRKIGDGTISAGRLYDKIEDYAYAKVMFVTHSSVIALVLDKDDVEKEEDEDDNETEEQAGPEVIIPKEQKSKKSKNAKNSIGFKG